MKNSEFFNNAIKDNFKEKLRKLIKQIGAEEFVNLMIEWFGYIPSNRNKTIKEIEKFLEVSENESLYETR